MKKVAFPICVSNANVQVKEISVYKTKLLGGQGAFREAVEWILMKQGRLENIFSIMDQNVQKM